MTQRVIIGQHSTGHIGLFVSRPGYDADLQDPNNRDAWLFSSNWSRVGSILGSGVCSINQRVYHYDPGYLPHIFFERYVNATTFPGESETSTSGGPNGNVATVEIMTPYVVVHYTQNSFQIQRQVPVANENSGATFRYIVFAIPIQ